MAPYVSMAILAGLLAVCSSLVTVRLSHIRSGSGREKEPHLSTSPQRGTRLNYFDLILIVILISFAALRFGIGTDYMMYLGLYTGSDRYNLGETIARSPQEIGYTTLMHILRGLSDWPYLIFWVASALTVIPAYLVLRRQSKHMVLAVALYFLFAFYLAPFNLVRQGIAVSLNFLAVTYLDRNRKVFWILNALAATFHVSVIIAALLQWFLARKRLGAKWYLWILASSVAGALLVSQVGVLGNLLNLMNPRYEGYLESGQTAGIGTYLMIAVKIAILTWVARLPAAENDSRYYLYTVVGLGFLILGTQSVVVARMEAYFWIFILLLLPNRIARLKNPLPATYIAMLVGAVYMMFYLLSYGELIPYRSYIFN